MYCGSNKTARLSQQLLSEAMFRLLAEKPFSSISVSELCREAEVSRQTFYSLFESKENVVTYTLMEHYCYTPETEGGNTCGTLRQMCVNYGEYVRENASLLRLLVENDIVYLLYDGLYDSLINCGCFLGGMTPEVRAYAADFMAGGFTSIARTYIRADAGTDAALLDDLIYSLFNGSLFLEWGRSC